MERGNEIHIKKFIYIFTRKSEAKEANRNTYPAGDDDSGNNGDQGDVGEPGLTLESHEVCEDGREERSGGSNGLIKGNGKVSQRDVSEDDGDAEYKAESGDLEELNSGSDCLHRNHLHPSNGDVAEQRTSRHVAHGQEDRVLEAIVAKQVLVQKQNPNVGGVPRRNQPDCEHPA